MKKFLFFFLTTISITSVIAQSVNIRFTGQMFDRSYIRLDSVKIENITRSWTEILNYPDTVLTISHTNIENASTNNATLKIFPNPLNGRTNLNLQLSNNDNVTLQIFNFAGQKIAEYSQNLEAGNYIFNLNLKTPQVYLAVLSTSQGRSTVKMVNRTKGGSNSIAIKGFGPLTEKMVSTQTFQIGDVLRYTGYATIAEQTVVSAPIQQAQSESERITLIFATPIAAPTVTTDTIINIADSSATCIGNVLASDTTIITRGFCYSTSHNPSLNDSVVSENINNTGTYLCNITNLNPRTTYYVRAYATNCIGTNYGIEKSFKTLATPIVTTDTITNITDSSATLQGNVVSDGRSNITARGFCYSTSHNPTLNDSVVLANTNDTGIYIYNLQNLIAGTTYYVRSFATNSIGTTYGAEKCLKILALPTVTTDTIINITDSSATLQGNVTFDGNTNIIARYFCYSTSHNPTLNDNVIMATTNDTGTYTCNLQNLTAGVNYYVRACVTNSIGTTYGAEKMFRTTGLFPGTLGGLFSVSASKQVRFSQGNLQWSATGGGSTATTHLVNGGDTAIGTWRFAEHQYDYIGNANSNTDTNYTGWIDLFAWSTSGYHDTNDPYNTHYQPYSTSKSSVNTTYNYFGYGPSTNQNDTNITNSNYDWGVYNAISNGYNLPNIWRTLTINEWNYLFNTRTASTINGTANARYAQAMVDSICGIMLFPDTFSWPNGAGTEPTIFNAHVNNYNWDSVTNYTIAQFTILENSGVVFLPASGYRNGTTAYAVGSVGHYWSSNNYSKKNACNLYFSSIDINPQHDGYKFAGISVRLVKDSD